MGYLPFIIALAGIAMPVALIYIIFNHENRSEERFHNTIQKLLDNGKELDEEVLSGIPGYKKVVPRDDVRNGINTLGVGVGLSLLGWVSLGSVITGVGLLVSCIGGALMANGYLNVNKSQHSELSQ